MTETTQVVTIARMALGSNVRKFRLEAGLTQDELARRAGMEQQALSALEKRDSKSSAFLVPLAQALGKTPQELLGLPDAAPAPSAPPVLDGGALIELMLLYQAASIRGRDNMLDAARAIVKVERQKQDRMAS